MNFWRNQRFWIAVGVVGLIVLVLITLNLTSNKSTEESATSSTTVPAANTTATASASPQEVTISSQKLAQNYFVYEKSEYEKARAANRPIFLFFYANWCPTCARQEPINVATFNSLTNPNVIGFRINYNDSDTSDAEETLAKEFGVRYQHTFFTLNSQGQQIDKFLGDTSIEKLKEFLARIN